MKKSQVRLFIDAILDSGGASYNVKTGKFAPKNGYFVSIPDCEKVLPSACFLSLIIKSYVKKYDLVLDSKERFLGGWINDNNKIVLDISLKYEDLETACLVGIHGSQKCIYDANEDRYINLPLPQLAGTERQQLEYARFKAQEIANNNGFYHSEQ